MPLYNYRCESCQSEWTKQLLIAERDSPVQAPCPQCACTEGTVERYLPSSNGLAYTLEKVHVPSTFSDLLKRIEQNTPGAKLNSGHWN